MDKGTLHTGLPGFPRFRPGVRHEGEPVRSHRLHG